MPRSQFSFSAIYNVVIAFFYYFSFKDLSKNHFEITPRKGFFALQEINFCPTYVSSVISVKRTRKVNKYINKLKNVLRVTNTSFRRSKHTKKTTLTSWKHFFETVVCTFETQ